MYNGHYKRKGIYRNVDNSFISCTDPKFDKYICMPWKDLEALVNACKDWED